MDGIPILLSRKRMYILVILEDLNSSNRDSWTGEGQSGDAEGV